MVFPSSSDSKASACNAGDLGLVPVLGRYPGGRNGNTLQEGCSPWGSKKSDTTEQLTHTEIV